MLSRSLAFASLATLLLLAPDAVAEPEQTFVSSLATFGEGDGPRAENGLYRLLDEKRSPRQSNAIAFDRIHTGRQQTVGLQFDLRVAEGGDGGSIMLLNTAEYGARGPAPFLKSWVEPNLKRSLAIGIDVHNPKNEEPFGPWGNYLDRPEREVSIHWDGRELVKRTAPSEFRGAFGAAKIEVQHVPGGAEVTISLGGTAVYERYFVAGCHPYESRLALGAGTRGKATTVFDVRNIVHMSGSEATPTRRPFHVGVFNHVLTNNKKTAYEAEVDLPPIAWSYGRVILTLEIHDAGKDWDEWDRNGSISLWDDEGVKRTIVPFITSYRTACYWKVDVTHFRPYLTGKRIFEVRAGTTFYKNRGYMMSVSLDFYPGKSELDAFQVVPLWNGTAKYKSAENHFQDFFTPIDVEIPADATAARVFTTTTGHSQVGEFTPSKRTLHFKPCVKDESAERQSFENTLWKTDCYLNPNRPQFGTWKYARAGWAPGDVVWPWWIDLTPHLLTERTARFTYTPTAYDYGENPRKPPQKEINKASHVVHSYLILYRPSTDSMSPPTLRIGSVAKDSAAKKAGIKRGDFLASYDGKQLEKTADLIAAIQAAASAKKETVDVVVYRGVERLELKIAPGRMGIGLAN